MILSFGGMSKKLSEQIEGLPKRFDKISESITFLSIHGFLTDSESKKARRRLIKEIEKFQKETENV